MDNRKNNHGKAGNKGGGRKKMAHKRTAHSVYAFELEWQLIKDFSKFVKQDFDACAEFVRSEDEALKNKKPVSFWTVELYEQEIRPWLKKNVKDYECVVFDILVYTGIDTYELRAIHYRDLDDTTVSICVSRGDNKRSIFMPPEIFDEVLNFAKETTREKLNGIVFKSINLNKLIKTLPVRYQIKPSVIRECHAFELLERGILPEDVCKEMGLASVEDILKDFKTLQERLKFQ